jgi:hypothetical protein
MVSIFIKKFFVSRCTVLSAKNKRSKSTTLLFFFGILYLAFSYQLFAVSTQAVPKPADDQAIVTTNTLVFIRLENYKGAIAYFEKFLELEPDAPEAGKVKSMIEELKKR